jgi:hypothetical protein
MARLYVFGLRTELPDTVVKDLKNTQRRVYRARSAMNVVAAFFALGGPNKSRLAERVSVNPH